MKSIRCAIRKIDVAAYPEELVRQRLLRRMVEALGYPCCLLAVEKELSLLPHLALNQHTIPKRRADILCFGKGIHPSHELYPLLLVECKSVPLNQKVLLQAAGYNHFVQAYFICISNQEDTHTGWYDPEKKRYSFVSFLPPYKELLRSVENQEANRKKESR